MAALRESPQEFQERSRFWNGSLKKSPHDGEGLNMPRLYVSTVIAAPIERVWQTIRDFNDLPKWHPLVAASMIEGGLTGDSIGAVRNFQLVDGGGTIREQLLAMSDTDRHHTYSILDSPLAVAGYVATLRLREVTETNQTFAEWSSSFDVGPADKDEMCRLITGIYQDGFKRLASILAAGRRS